MRVRLDLRSSVLRNSKFFATVARFAIESAILVNRAHLRAFPNTPPLYSSGVRYRREPPGVEDFSDIEAIIRRGYGDCAQLVAWRVAELRERGEAAGVRIIWRKYTPRGKPRVFHVQVRREDGRIEDPSVRLGMRSGDAVTPAEKPMIGYQRKDR